MVIDKSPQRRLPAARAYDWPVSVDAEQRNRRVWASSRVREIFVRRTGFSDAGEESIVRRITSEVRDRPILDIGVGAGRTVPFLRALSNDYVAVDFLPEMVALTRSRFPDARVEQADARDLDGFPDERFGFVYFSFNGIDGIAHVDRARVYAAVLRVLRPGGLFVFSTHNLDHRCAGRPPWSRCRFELRAGARRFAANIVRLPQSAISYKRLQWLATPGRDWAELVDPAYHYGLVLHYVTLAEAQRELIAAGFAPEVEIYTPAGVRAWRAGETHGSHWLHLLAHKPARVAESP